MLCACLPQLARDSEFVRRDGRAGTEVTTRTSAPTAVVGRQTLHPASGGKTEVVVVKSMTDIQTATAQVVCPVTAMLQRLLAVVMAP